MKPRWIFGDPYKGCTTCESMNKRIAAVQARSVWLKGALDREHALRMEAEANLRKVEEQLRAAAAKGFVRPVPPRRRGSPPKSKKRTGR